MKYEEMSNWELGLEVCKIEMRGQFIIYHNQEVNELLEVAGFDGRSDVVKFTTSSGSKQEFSVCNLSQIIPIAIEQKLKIEWLDDDEGDYCNVQSPCGSVFGDDEKLCRAIAICFLKMKDAEVK